MVGFDVSVVEPSGVKAMVLILPGIGRGILIVSGK
jgi:hypothetical protein